MNSFEQASTKFSCFRYESRKRTGFGNKSGIGWFHVRLRATNWFGHKSIKSIVSDRPSELKWFQAHVKKINLFYGYIWKIIWFCTKVWETEWF